MENREILDMRNITKDFSGVKALDNITIKVKKGVFAYEWNHTCTDTFLAK